MTALTDPQGEHSALLVAVDRAPAPEAFCRAVAAELTRHAPVDFSAQGGLPAGALVACESCTDPDDAPYQAERNPWPCRFVGDLRRALL